MRKGDKTSVLPDYSPGKFVNRKEEIDTFRRILSESQPITRIMILEGERGIGKTWLALHLHRTVLSEIPQVKSIYVSLEAPGEDYHPWGKQLQKGELLLADFEEAPTERLVELFSWIVDQWDVHLPPEASITEITARIIEHIQNQIYEKFVFIMDSIYETSWNFLEKAEEEFFSRFISFPNVFMVITGRGRPYPWKMPEIASAVKFGLESFSNKQIEEQIERLDLSTKLSVEEIRILGAGVPLCTAALAQAGDFRDGLTLTSELLFTVVQPQERSKIRSYFEALCLLEGFREEDIPPMLSSYFDDVELENISSEEIRQIRDALLATHLTRWEFGRFVITDPVRTVLGNYLFHVKPIFWQRLHCRAYQYYMDLQEKPEFRRFVSFLAQKAAYHEGELRRANLRPEDCIQQTKQEAIS